MTEHISTNALLHEYPLASRFIERMRTVDPNFGDRIEEEYIIKHLNDAQRFAPCPVDHEHDGACYSRDTWHYVTRDYRKRNTR